VADTETEAEEGENMIPPPRYAVVICSCGSYKGPPVLGDTKGTEQGNRLWARHQSKKHPGKGTSTWVSVYPPDGVLPSEFNRLGWFP